MNRDAIVIKESDNVATALHDLPHGQPASVGIGDETISVILVGDIELGHKFAIRDISRGQNIIKYGEIIGRATDHIAKGAHAHVQNIESLRGRGDLS
ncbi:D-galactarate dehydratase [Desulfosarcina widdelii]|uniref:D-galactarate dehydratase n=1 Tax=Desulfosarcina widdelii TaxID=947919 RepID=A0A5K7ZEC6_9BACT|nr:UxaA family hydrolase [Desulfosarcina widdelii]BBO78509.1 D-galactarate dehydratase [Desulfosarcina widdelii]